MVSSAARVSIRVVFVILVLAVAFYVGRPLYWKLSATIHEIREKRQTVKEGISLFVLEAQRSVGWVHDESDPGASEGRGGGNVRVASTRRLRVFSDFNRSQRFSHFLVNFSVIDRF